jgi:hypothetical protein
MCAKLLLLLICDKLLHPRPDHLTEWSVEVNKGPKGIKGTLRLDFQANTRILIFLKARVTTRNRKEVERKSRNN